MRREPSLERTRNPALGERTTAQAVREALTPFTEPDGPITVPLSYRVVIARNENAERWDNHDVSRGRTVAPRPRSSSGEPWLRNHSVSYSTKGARLPALVHGRDCGVVGAAHPG